MYIHKMLPADIRMKSKSFKLYDNLYFSMNHCSTVHNRQDIYDIIKSFILKSLVTGV